jgi:hypothetical protein
LSVPKMRASKLSRTTLLAFLGTKDATFRHAALARRLGVHRGGGGASRVPGGTAFRLQISPCTFLEGGRFAGRCAGSLDGEPEAAEGDRRRWRLLGKCVVGVRGRGRWRGRGEWASGMHGRGGFGSFGRSIPPEEEEVRRGRGEAGAGRRSEADHAGVCLLCSSARRSRPHAHASLSSTHQHVYGYARSSKWKD